MPKAILIVDNVDFGKHVEWYVRAMSYMALQNVLEGRLQTRRPRSYWLVHLGSDRYMPDGNYVGILKREHAKGIPDVFRTMWFKEKIVNFYEVAQFIREKGEELGVKEVIITSSHAGKDFRRNVAKQLMVEVLNDEKYRFAKFFRKLRASSAGDYAFTGRWKDGVFIGVLYKKGIPVAGIIDYYVIGHEEELNEFVAKILAPE